MKNIIIAFILISNIASSQYNDSLDNQIVKHRGFILSYNEGCEQANWVYYMVTKIDLDNKSAIRHNKFIEDTLISTGSASTLDYYKSGYDRGHLAPSASFTHDQSLNNETFVMSNMSPQSPSFNRGMWKKLETYEREIAKRLDTVYVLTGPILNDSLETIGTNEVCVPNQYFKVFINSKSKILECYLMDNVKLKGEVSDFKVSIDYINSIIPVRISEIVRKCNNYCTSN